MVSLHGWARLSRRPSQTVQGVAIGVENTKGRIGSVYTRAGTGPSVNHSVRRHFLVREEDRISRDSKSPGKSPGCGQGNTGVQPSINDDLPERLIKLSVQWNWRTRFQVNLRDDRFDRCFQNGSFKS